MITLKFNTLYCNSCHNAKQDDMLFILTWYCYLKNGVVLVYGMCILLKM